MVSDQAFSEALLVLSTVPEASENTAEEKVDFLPSVGYSKATELPCPALRAGAHHGPRDYPPLSSTPHPGPRGPDLSHLRGLSSSLHGRLGGDGVFACVVRVLIVGVLVVIGISFVVSVWVLKQTASQRCPALGANPVGLTDAPQLPGSRVSPSGCGTCGRWRCGPGGCPGGCASAGK